MTRSRKIQMKDGLPTIRDVAARAGVSVGTASRAFSDGASISDHRRERVIQAASEIGYRPNELARSLRQRRTNVIGLCVPMIASAYFAAMLETLDDVSASANRRIMQVMSGGDPDRELDRIDSLINGRVDGIILMPSSAPSAALDLLHEMRTPTVIIDRIVDEERFDLILLDHRRAMIDVVNHLTALGHKRILFVVRHPELVTTKIRIDTFKEIAAASGGTLQAEIAVTVLEETRLGPILSQIFSRPDAPTAIITSNSINTLWTLRAMQDLGLSIPRDISLVAFDEPVWGELVSPPLTVIRQPTKLIAELAWSLLTDRIEDFSQPPQRRLVSNEFIVRGSTQRLAT